MTGRPGPVLSQPWAERGFSLRRETAADTPFLERLFVAVRTAMLDLSGWPDEARQSFLATQFSFQTRHYANAYPGADIWIVTRGDDPVGRFYLDHGADIVRVIDISLLPDQRGAGLGTALLQALQAEGKPIGLQVDRMNPGAQNLYRRLGFVEAGQGDISMEMIWQP